MTTLRVACLQLNVGPTWADHKETTLALCHQAAQAGAKLIALPENTSGMIVNKPPVSTYDTEDTHPMLKDLAAFAKETQTWVLCGSVAVRHGDKLANRSILFSPTGQSAATYDKIHLFNATLDTGEVYRESHYYCNGNKAVLAPLSDGVTLGLSICHDVRFASLYRLLAQNGANLLAVPSAFAVATGEAHWEVMLRTRAIETGAFVIAPAQCGTHDGGRQTYGHSLIVNPWGKIIADAGTDVGYIIADLDFDEVTKARTILPSFKHDCPFSLD